MKGIGSKTIRASVTMLGTLLPMKNERGLTVQSALRAGSLYSFQRESMGMHCKTVTSIYTVSRVPSYGSGRPTTAIPQAVTMAPRM